MSNSGHARALRLAVFMVACLFGQGNLGFAAESPDADRAAKLFKQALALRAQGHALEPQTIKLLQDAANLGQTEAQDIIGQLYLNGAGLPRNSAEAFNWFKRAADGGLAMGQDHLANLYENGVSTRTNLVMAFVLFQKAAEQGLADAQFDLAQVYREGRGVPTNNAFALRWYLKAALQGHPGAQVNLAGMYAEGEGVPRDVEEAYKWLTLAILSGHPVADRNRKSLALTMSPEQIYEARKRVDAFRSATNAPAPPVKNQK